MVAEANVQQVAFDSRLPVVPPPELPNGTPMSNKEKNRRSWRHIETPELFLGAVSLYSACPAADREECSKYLEVREMEAVANHPEQPVCFTTPQQSKPAACPYLGTHLAFKEARSLMDAIPRIPKIHKGTTPTPKALTLAVAPDVPDLPDNPDLPDVPNVPDLLVPVTVPPSSETPVPVANTLLLEAPAVLPPSKTPVPLINALPCWFPVPAATSLPSEATAASLSLKFPA